MTFQLAVKNNLRHPFSDKIKFEGRKWIRHFLKRHSVVIGMKKLKGKALSLECPSTSGKTPGKAVKKPALRKPWKSGGSFFHFRK